MVRRAQRTTFQARLDMTERAAAGPSDSTLAADLSCSVWTVRTWRRRGEQHGRTGLTSHMRRPARGALSTYPSTLREAMLQMRQAHPGWGPATLLAELRLDPA